MRHAPGPSFVTALRGMRSDAGGLAGIPEFLTATARRYGAVASWRMPQARFWLVDDPALIETVLLAGGDVLMKGRGLRRMRRLLGLGLLTSDEPLHLRRRRLVQPAFHRDRIAAYARTMIEAAHRTVVSLRAGEVVAVDALMNRLALRIAAATLFSAQLDDDANEIAAALTEALAVFPRALAPYAELLDHIPWHPATRRFAAARARLDGIVFRLIARRRRDAVDRGDLLSILLQARDEDGDPMPDELIRDEVLTLLLAGHETTANALTWAWDALARDGASERRLHAELDAVLGDREPVADDAARLPFTRDVVAETLRLRPPAWLLGRRVARPFRLGEFELPRGAAIFVAQIVTHRNPSLWHEPERFRPERWSNGETRALPRFAYFPFGGGNRGCIGEQFAWTEAILALATLARCFRFRSLDPSPVPLEPSVTLRPARPILMRVEARDALVGV